MQNPPLTSPSSSNASEVLHAPERTGARYARVGTRLRVRVGLGVGGGSARLQDRLVSSGAKIALAGDARFDTHGKPCSPLELSSVLHPLLCVRRPRCFCWPELPPYHYPPPPPPHSASQSNKARLSLEAGAPSCIARPPPSLSSFPYPPFFPLASPPLPPPPPRSALPNPASPVAPTSRLLRARMG